MKLRSEIKVGADLFVDGNSVDFVDTITMRGLETIASCLGSPFSFNDWMPFIAIGDGEVAPSTEDEALQNELYRKRGSVTNDANSVTIEATFGATEPASAFTLREIGLLDRISGGDLAARWSVDDTDIEAGGSVVITCIVYTLP